MIEAIVTSFMLGTTNPNTPHKPVETPKENAVLVENNNATKSGKQIRAKFEV